MAAVLLRVLRALPLLIVSPLLLALSATALFAADLSWFLFGRRQRPHDTAPRHGAATVVIPNWNGRDLLERYLPSVVAALAGNPENEILVVENASSDGSAEFVRRAFPQVRLLELERNLGFGGGCNAGCRAAKNDVVVLLNSDMRVEPDFLAPLLRAFGDPAVFAVSCQIFFSDPAKKREETGLTEGWWQDGGLRVGHRIDPEIDDLFPCFYGGGGSCAFDRRKFLELGGFDHILAPFYLEDTDLGYQAWKRGWKVLYQPGSVVWHEHRGTIGKRFSDAFIQSVLRKNFILFSWKNFHEWRRLAANLFFTYAGALLSVILGDEPGRATLGGSWAAFRQLPGALRSRWRARSLAVVDDTEAFLRPQAGYFRDRFAAMEPAPSRLRVLFVSPYPICPPVHGGGVFMYQTLREMAKMAEVHVVELLDYAWQETPNLELREFCASAEWIVRLEGRERQSCSIQPHAVLEFANRDLAWLINRQIYRRRIDVVQLEYTPMAQYAGRFRRMATALFEHDVYFQSISRGLAYMRSPLDRVTARVEYLRALRYEMRVLPQMDQVQVCSRENGEYLARFLPRIAPRMKAGLRAGIDTAGYEFRPTGRDPLTLFFLGSFRHEPNKVALEWFIREVLPAVVASEPGVKVLVAGSDPPPPHAYGDQAGALVLLGFVEDIKDLMGRCAVFICPILSGSGVRVKLLEAFAAGIPVVSTTVGAEGLARKDGEVCALADEPAAFAEKVVTLLRDPEAAAEMARRARAEVVDHWDMATITRELVAGYAELVREKRAKR